MIERIENGRIAEGEAMNWNAGPPCCERCTAPLDDCDCHRCDDCGDYMDECNCPRD